MSSKAALAAMLLTTVSALRQAEAFEVKHAPGGQLVRWTQSSFAFTVDRSVRRVPGGEAAVASATRAWTKQAGAPKLSVATTTAKLEPGLDGKSGVFFAPDGFEPAGDALAITILSFDDATGSVLEADIVLNGRYKLGHVGPSATRPSSEAEKEALVYDVDRVVAHEMGHALALSDEMANEEALMYPFVQRARALRATPGADDIAGLETLYGAASIPEPTSAPGGAPDAKPTGCGGIVARSGPSSAPWTAALAVGFIVSALVIARSRRRGRAGAAGAAVVVAGALVLLPPSTLGGVRAPAVAVRGPAFEARALIESVRTTSVAGVFRSEIELRTLSCESSDCPASGRTEVWGGTLDGVRQVVGGVDVPRAGDHVGVVFDRGAGRAVKTLVRVAQEGRAR